MIHNHVHQITLPTPFPVGDVHVYFIDDKKKVLVDCGCKTEESYELLAKKLKKLGSSLDEIDELWLTHAHPDHSGLSTRLQKKHGVSVGIHQTELRYMQKINLLIALVIGSESIRFRNI
jgi:glyoxylase-like metal-dependent hydrolase (beta-lactamase superfamily II)